MRNMVDDNPGIIQLLEPLPDTVSSVVADRMTEQRDLLVKEAINYAMGRDDWEPIDIRLRGKFFSYPDGRTEFVFDGQHLLTFYPPETLIERDDENGQVTVKGIQRYRRHYTPGAQP